MTFQEIADLLQKKFGEAITLVKADAAVDPFITVSAASIKDIALYLREDESLAFDYLSCLSGVDRKGTLEVVYHIASMTLRHKLVLKVSVPTDRPEVPSVESVWKSANWHEREAYDLLGIIFTDHPDLRRILLPYDWEGYPLRKDYEVPEFYNGMRVPY
ncbi:MAG TPA: NADH-quinone oxidoreductase subunit C [Bacteroidota bacterium]|nr:NADH-quinone oxidoreductase subunit C [Bacteroidota bacterium]